MASHHLETKSAKSTAVWSPFVKSGRVAGWALEVHWPILTGLFPVGRVLVAPDLMFACEDRGADRRIPPSISHVEYHSLLTDSSRHDYQINKIKYLYFLLYKEHVSKVDELGDQQRTVHFLLSPTSRLVYRALSCDRGKESERPESYLCPDSVQSHIF